jgi:phage baseplate assembly protein W
MANRDLDKTFLGRGWGFPPEFRKHSKEVKMVAENPDIQESLAILLSTRPSERLMHPTFGCSIHDIIFESINESTITEIKDRIQKAILFFEPRITLDSIFVETDEAYNGVLRILLEYTIRTTNTRSNLVYPFYLKEGTNTGFLLGTQHPANLEEAP